MSGLTIAAIAPFVVLVLAFVVYCWMAISRSEVRYLPKWLWRVVVVFSIPLGGVVYLMAGREPGSAR